jgi:hypothetical protein
MSLSEGADHKAWIEKIKSELKGKDLHLYDYVWDGIHISPFEELKPIRRRLRKKEDNDWFIGAEIDHRQTDLNTEFWMF